MSSFQTFRDVAICVALLIVPFFFLSAHLKEPSRTNALDRVLLQISGPIQSMAHTAAVTVTGVVEDYVYLTEVKTENDSLRAENDRLKREVRDLRMRAARTDELDRLLGLRSRFSAETVTARVIAKDISPSFRVLRLSLEHGGGDTVRVGQPVISTAGLVGQVRRVSGKFADVLLTVDAESRVDVVVRRTGARGRLEGLGHRERYACRVQFDRPEDEVRVGDEVYTSGLGRKFPASILLGYVSQVGEREFGLHQEGVVTPSVDFTRLSEVLILTGDPEGAREAPPVAKGQ